jgi:hypothetical protein
MVRVKARSGPGRNRFSRWLYTPLHDAKYPRHVAEALESPLGVLATGGSFGKDRIRNFNG